MESDNYWNSDGTITAAVQEYHQRPDGGYLDAINRLESFLVGAPQQRTVLVSWTENLGRHCCGGDPKFSPDMETLAYALFSKPRGREGDWDIILRTGEGNEIDISQNDFMDLYPMWSQDGKLVWTSWDAETGTVSFIVRNTNGKTTRLPMAGDEGGVKTLDDGRNVEFLKARWPEWHHPDDKRIIFVATYRVVD